MRWHKLKPAEGYETVPFHFEDGAARRDRDYLSGWEVTSSFLPESPTPTPTTTSRSRACRCWRSPRPSPSPACSGRELSPARRAPRARPRRDAGGDPARGAAGAARPHPRRRHGPRPRVRLRLHALGLSARRPERRSTWCCAPTTASSIPEFRAGIGVDGETYRVELRRGADGAALPAAAHDAAPGHARPADRDGGRAVGRGDLHRQVCPGEGAVPLGPARQAGREQLLLRARLLDLGAARAGASSRSRASARR